MFEPTFRDGELPNWLIPHLDMGLETEALAGRQS